MKLDNIEEARILIAQRNTLLDLLDKNDKWGSGHFEFVEHCGSHPDRISLPNSEEIKTSFIEIVTMNVKQIEERLKEL